MQAILSEIALLFPMSRRDGLLHPLIQMLSGSSTLAVCPKTLIRRGRQVADLTHRNSSKFGAHKQMILGQLI